MTLSFISPLIGVILIAIYCIAFAVKHKNLPNLGALLLLFLCGPLAEEVWALVVIAKRYFYDREQLYLGIIESHMLIVTFGAVALLYAMFDTVIRSFRDIYK